MALKKLPIGYSSLSAIRQYNCAYVDKTQFVEQLVEGGRYYFLARPRRFGKSLLVDTLHQAFAGKKELFKNCYLENQWDWSVSYPVIYLGFGGSSACNSEHVLNAIIHSTLDETARAYQVDVELTPNYGIVLFNLVRRLHEKYQKPVVVLVDEYDKPILDVITDSAQAKINREILKSLYGVLKELDVYLKFVLLAGVSKFSKISLFSGLNNLNDISLDQRYADICGYTQAELENTFAEYLVDVDKVKLKQWYNGYNFDGHESQKVYNPFDILLFFDKNKIYRSYWFETGTPTFLVKLFEKNKYYLPDLEQVVMPETSLGSIDVDSIPIETLAFQTGYLTIKRSYEQMGRLWYDLTYPNQEVKISLNECLVQAGITATVYSQNVQRIYAVLSARNFVEFKTAIQALFSAIPHGWYRNNHIQHYEGFYCSLVYGYFCAAGYEVVGEDVTNKGQIDLTIKDSTAIFIFEFKVKAMGDSASSAHEALQQIKAKGYANKYKASGKPIYLLGMLFDGAERNLVDLVWEEEA